MLYKLESDFCILVMESGASVTISDALKYLDLDIKVAPEKPDTENEGDAALKSDDEETEDKEEPHKEDDPNLPKVVKLTLF